MKNAIAAPRPDAALAELTEWVEKQLPAAADSLLVLGDVSPALHTALLARGHQLTILPWRAAQYQVDPPAGAQGELRQVGLNGPPRQAFDGVLALDLAADIHPLGLLEGLQAVLAPQGVVLIAGEGTRGTWTDYWPALVTRCGFEMTPQPDADVLPDESAPGRLETSFKHVLHRPATPPRWLVGHASPGDFEDIATLFEGVFGHPLSRPLWEWKYGSGRGNAVLVRSEGHVVAHYGGIYRDILRSGTPDRVAQIGDVMVLSKERGVLTRNGPFFLMGSSWPEVYGPRGFGFPNSRAMRVAEKMGLYTQAGHMAQVRWQPSAPRARLGSRVRSLRRGHAGDAARLDALWADMANDLRSSVLGVRDSAYLERRFFSHPENQYEVLLVSARFTGKPLGVVVLRRLEDACELLDVIAPLANFERVIDQARRLCGRWGLPSLYGWTSSTQLPVFLIGGGVQEPLNVQIPASSWTADPQSELFVGKWWMTSGDTDFR